MTTYPKLLIVDDALFMREVIRDALGDLFDEVLTAPGLAESLDLLRREHPSLATVDMSLDARNPVQGLEVVQELRNASPTSRVIVVSALSQDWLREQVLEAGADAYLVKPFEKTALRQTAVQLLEAPHA